VSSGERRYSDRVIYRRVLGEARPYWGHIVAIFLLTLLATPVALLAPVPLKIAVDSLLGDEPLPGFLGTILPQSVEESTTGLLIFTVLLLAAIKLLSELQTLCTRLLRAYTSERLALRFRSKLFRHAQRLSMTYHDRRGSADANYRIQRDAEAIPSVAVSGVIPFVSSAVMFAAMIRWKLLDCGGEIAFAPAAQVWHHRRRTVRGYLRQQRGYGRAERMLLGAHPQRFNRLGQARRRGVIYGGASVLPSLLRPVVYHGYLGSAPFQPVAKDRAAAANMWIGAFVPFTVPLAALGLLLGVLVAPWWALLPVLMAEALVSYGAAVAIGTRPPNHEPNPRQLGFVVGMLHVAQPFVRMWGRLRGSSLHALPTENPSWSGDRLEWLRAPSTISGREVAMPSRDRRRSDGTFV
jgi:ABC-type multidrug transport system fused ATPase/permease subunit